MRISDWSSDVCSSDLPIVGAPLAFGADGVGNSEVHNVGEVWAEMLWEVYASLLNHHDFQTAQDRMKDYVIGGLKMTPSSPTFTEERDGVLAEALATDAGDYALAARAFANRGQIGRASGRARVYPFVLLWVVTLAFTKTQSPLTPT